jgi:hypothetical protein
MVADHHRRRTAHHLPDVALLDLTAFFVDQADVIPGRGLTNRVELAWMLVGIKQASASPFRHAIDF